MQITPAQISSIVQTTINQQLTDRICRWRTRFSAVQVFRVVIQDPRLDLYKDDRKNQPLEDVDREHAHEGHSHPDRFAAQHHRNESSAFTISFSYNDAHKAHDTVQALITKFQDANLTTQRNQQNVVNSFVHDELSEAKRTSTSSMRN